MTYSTRISNERVAAAAQGNSFWRACTALALGRIRHEDPEDLVDRVWGRDATAQTIVKMITKAAVTPLDATAASVFLPTAHTTLLTGLAPDSAAAELFSRCTRLDFENTYQVIVPRIGTSTAPIFAGEGNPVIVVQDATAGVTFGPPDKLVFSAVFTAELEKYAIETASVILQRGLLEKAGIALDAAVFDANAASAGVRPAGLLNGLSTLGATSGGGLAALVADVGKICTAMTTAQLSTKNLLLIMNQADAKRAHMLSPLALPETIGTLGVTAGTIIGVCPQAIGSGFEGGSEVEVVTDAAAVMQNVSTEFVTSGGVLGAPVLSLYQMNLLGIKIRTKGCWGPLATGAVQMISSVTW